VGCVCVSGLRGMTLTKRPSLSIFVCAQYSRSEAATKSGLDSSMFSITYVCARQSDRRLRG
jgi:hypothetical protein